MRNVARFVLAGGLAACVSAAAQVVYAPAPIYAPAPPVAVPAAAPILTGAQLEQLTGPIALYPDPLIAQILPASTYGLEIVTASQWLASNPQSTEDAINAQPWEPSVKALVHYPTVLQMMAGNIGWAGQLGSAFQTQPADVMNSIQRLRAEAQAAGTLYSTPQQQVLVQNGAILIVPAQPNVVYVPTYDPAVVYVRRREPIRDAIRFNLSFGLGRWLNMGVDWDHHYVADGYRWDHERREFHPGPVIVEQPRPWMRVPDRPVIVTPRRFAPEVRGWAPAPRPAPQVFGAYERREDVERERARGNESIGRRIEPAPQHGPSDRGHERVDHERDK